MDPRLRTDTHYPVRGHSDSGTPVKLLTVRQPHASLIAVGAKSIETRSWKPPVSAIGQPLIIHAGASPKTWNDLDAPNLMSERTTIQAVLAALPGVMIEEGGWHATSVRVGWKDFDGQPIPDSIGFSGLNLTLPLGAVVASCVLADVVPIMSWSPLDGDPTWAAHMIPDVGSDAPRMILVRDHITGAEALAADGPLPAEIDCTDQLPFGDFSTSPKQRYAWLLEDVRATTDRCPACWGHGAVCIDCGYAGELPTAPPPVFHDGCEFGRGFGVWKPCPLCDATRGCDPILAKGRQGLWEWDPLSVSHPVTRGGV